MNREALDDLKQQIRLLDYLQAHDWRPARRLSRGRLTGLCPLHTDHEPSFLVDPRKNLFYCYGCGRGGDVIRFAELYHVVTFPQALSLLRQWHGMTPLLHEVAAFYCTQLHRHAEAVVYLSQRGIYSPEVVPPKYSESSVMIEVDQVLPTAVVGPSTAAFDAGRAVFLV